MGSYIYTRRSKVIEAFANHGAERYFVNTFQYATKPYWNLWDARADRWMSDWEKATVRAYNLLRATARRTVDKLERKGWLSDLFTTTYEGKVCTDDTGMVPVYSIRNPRASWLIDDAIGDKTMPLVGWLKKSDDGTYELIRIEKTYKVGELIPASEVTE